jgi:hypothetical protein
MMPRRAPNKASNLVFICPGCGPRPKQESVAVCAPNTALDGLIEAASKIAQKNAALRRDLIAAIQHDDVAATLQAACAIARIEPIGSIRDTIHSHTKAVA